MKVLVGCEYTGTVRRAFERLGHDAWSCDYRAALDGSNHHIRGDVLEAIAMDNWDLLMIAHPPCTRLCNSGVRWLDEPPGKLDPENYSLDEVHAYARMTRDERHAFMWDSLEKGAKLFSDLWNCKIPRKCLENPVMHKHAKKRIVNYREFAQSFQPWAFGDPEAKRICLWLDNLEPLKPTYNTWDECRAALGLPVDAKPDQRVHDMAPGKERSKERSRFFDGAANAMALQFAGVAQ